MIFVKPSLNLASFTCPNCGVLSEHTWAQSITVSYDVVEANGQTYNRNYIIPQFLSARCNHCKKHSYWIADKMMYPMTGIVELPNIDMPNDVREDYNEARQIVNISPRGAAALLRLALQKLCIHLGEKGKNINEDIKSLVKKGLHESIQQALDSVRVVGNHAVHPGHIDLKDDYETAYKLFGFVNIICQVLITEPKRIQQFYEYTIPENLREEIAKRDRKAT